MKSYFLIILLIVVSFSCAKKHKVETYKGARGDSGSPGTSCSTLQLEYGAKISCTDGTFSYVYNGNGGSVGENGSSCSVEANEYGATITCDNGTSASIENGNVGPSGDRGNSGADAPPCTLEETEKGVIISCGDESAVVYNGQDAEPSVGIGINTYASANCTQILDTGKYVKYNGTNATLYSSSNCASNTKVAQINDGKSYWLSATLLGVKSSAAFRVINFSSEE